MANGAGSGSWKKRIFKVAASLTPNASAFDEGLGTYSGLLQSFTVTGCLSTDTLMGVQPPSNPGATVITHVYLYSWRITGDNTVEARVSGIGTPPAGTYTFTFYRP